MELAATNLQAKIFWVKFEAVWMLPSATGMACFVLEYAWPGRWLNRRNLTLLSIPPLILLGIILTDNRYHLMWRGFDLNGTVFPQLGIGGWLGILYSFGLVFLIITIFAWLFSHSPPHRWPVAIMITGQIGFRILFILEKINLVQSELPIDVIGLAFMSLMYGIALFGFRIFDPIPLARQTAIRQLGDGMLVLDQQGNVASLNPAAERMLGVPNKQVQGKPIANLLPTLPELPSPLNGSRDVQYPNEMIIGSADEKRCYELDFSPLNDFREIPVGQLLLLHDVTEQRRSQEQILEQQRALATSNERERLAHELHDELAQQLALINLQAHLVSGLLDSGQAEQAQAQLQVLARAAREAQVDVRGEISKLSGSITWQLGFIGALKQYIDTFQQTCGIEIQLVVPVADQTISLLPTVAVQLLRIAQEALTNIRKHANAKHACVSLTRENGGYKLMIKDDGVGFDPQSLSASHQSFGLGFISTRAKEFNGRVEVQSTPGEGTLVTVIVPQEAS
jgi:PAS domain S-box-containing protein